MGKHKFLFFSLLILYSQILNAAIPTFKSWPIGEKSYQTSSLVKSEYSLDMAQMENQFFVVEVNQKFDFKKHSPIYEVSLEDGAPIEVNVSWLLGHRFKGKPFIEDIVIPMHQENLHQLPKENFPEKHRLLIEIKSTLTSGLKEWSGNLTLRRLDSKLEIKIPLKVKIHKFAMPASFHMKTSFGFAPWTIVRKHKILFSLEDVLYKKYFDMAREHRIDLHKMYVEFSKDEKFILSKANNPAHTFFNMWQTAQGSDGSYTRMQLTDLPVPEEFKTDSPKNEKFWQALNTEARGNKSFYVYFDDEPTPEKLKKIIPALTQIKKWAPDLRFMMTTNWIKELDSLVQIWCPNLIFWNQPNFPSPGKYEELVKKGDELWVYVSCNSHGCAKNEVTGLSDLIIDRPSSYAYSFPWVAERVGASGILYYDTVRAYLESEKSPWQDPKLFNGPGEGNLFYPCPKNVCALSTPEVFPSLRLKILQSALQSLEIYQTAALKDKKIIEKRSGVVRNARTWARKISEYEDIKKQSLEILDAN